MAVLFVCFGLITHGRICKIFHPYSAKASLQIFKKCSLLTNLKEIRILKYFHSRNCTTQVLLLRTNHVIGVLHAARQEGLILIASHWSREPAVWRLASSAVSKWAGWCSPADPGRVAKLSPTVFPGVTQLTANIVAMQWNQMSKPNHRYQIPSWFFSCSVPPQTWREGGFWLQLFWKQCTKALLQTFERPQWIKKRWFKNFYPTCLTTAVHMI